ncbi:type 2 DNA topoisomerase 6 subunit B-like [Perognathus longimembris pacificus]|uniref:type 2 DNA topoisomerase 6 subunit B-like n=1 Tax=Perognathus longimembris pacificus TaxID=214514 RepID=UPI0020198A1B|nr:type 2 DNA topoisomerase 6 subunit B-like [Perognathus longimembris pacificus]
MEGTALAICETLRYLIIHWKCEAGVSKRTLLKGQLVISIEALTSKHQPNSLHCVATIASSGNIYGLSLKKFLKETQTILPAFSAKLTWTSEESSWSQDKSGVTPFQITFEVDETSRTLVTDCLVIKHFLRKIIMVNHQIRFNFSVKVNGVVSTEIIGLENEPTLNLWSGIALVVNCQHYVSRQKCNPTEPYCRRIHPVLGHPVALHLPDGVAGVAAGGLVLTPAAALCPQAFSSQSSRISSLYIFLYGPSGLPLILPKGEKQSTIVFKDTSYFIDWKKYQLCMVPNVDLNLDTDLVLPDVSYRVESSVGIESQKTDSQGPALLLFLFVDFHGGLTVQQKEIWGVYPLLTAHLSAILMESHSVVRDSIQFTVDQVLEPHHLASQAYQKLQASLSVAVNSIMSVVTGSTSSSFRNTCLQAFQASDSQELGTKLHKIFHGITQHRFFHHCSCDMKQHLTPEEDPAQSPEDAPESGSTEPPAGTGGQAESKRLKKGGEHRRVETGAPHAARAPGPPEDARRRPAPSAAPLAAGGGAARAARGGPGSGLEDALWRQEVSNLSEWLSPGPQR